MIKIGFIDNFLSEWHANNYPDMIRKNPRAQELGMDVCYAWAKEEVSPYDGITTDEWCAKFGVQRTASIAELVEKSDCIVVLSPDNPELHVELSREALASGKPTYIDKTFSTSRAEAEALFDMAKAGNTPMYSTSSLRFADELIPYRADDVLPKSCMVVGPFKFEIYAIHIFEIMCAVMKQGAKRLMAVQNSRNRNIVVDYGDGRYASFIQMHADNHPSVKFHTSVELENGSAFYHEIKSDYFGRFIEALVGFFDDHKPVVPAGETIDLMGMLEVAKKALEQPFCWFDI